MKILEDWGFTWGGRWLVPDGMHFEFVRFPEEGHELSRSGSPAHRVMRFEIILEWLGRYLQAN